MKKNIVIIISIAVVLLLIIISFNINEKESEETYILSDEPEVVMENAKKESEKAKTKKIKEFEEITFDNFLTRYNNSNEELFLIGSTTCQYSKIAEPILKEISKDYNIDIRYLDASKFTKENDNKLIEIDEELFSNFGTPLLILTKDGNIIDKINGMTDKAHYIEFFKINGFIKE